MMAGGGPFCGSLSGSASRSGRPLRLELVGVAGAEVLAALQALSFENPWDEAAFAAVLSGAGTQGLVVMSGEVPGEVSTEVPGHGSGDFPVGFAVMRCVAGEAEVITLGVVPLARRAGVGRALVLGVLDVARAAGAQCVFLEVSERNGAARSLYAGCGFEEVGRREGYYADGAAALTCRRDLV